MLDCLLKNTEYIENVKKYMNYVAADILANEGDPSFKNVYKALLKDGVELGARDAGAIYNDMFANKKGFTPIEEVNKESAKHFEDTARNLLVKAEDKNELKERKLGKLSAQEDIISRIVKAFKGEDVKDEATKSTLATIRDLYTKVLKRSIEAKKGEKVSADKPWQEIAKEGIEAMNIGEQIS